MSSQQSFEFPNCWNDDIRMSALFAPLRSKSINPTDWNSKMKFWGDLIERWCKHSKCPVIDLLTLKKAFSRKNLEPACLNDVIIHLSSTEVLMTKDKFLSLCDSWKSWAISIVTSPLRWTFNTVKSTIIKNNSQEDVQFVHLAALQYLGDCLLSEVPSSYRGQLINYEEILQWEILSPENLAFVLHWLQIQKLVVIRHHNDSKLVKISVNGAKNINITDLDISVYSIRKQQQIFEDSIKKLETEKEAALEKAKKHLAAKNKNLAKMSLQRKHKIESMIEKRATAVENIQDILDSIEQAALESEVISCYQKGTATLKNIFKKFSLDEETVEGTMEELRTVLDSRKDIEEALSQPIDPLLEKDLEDELNEILQQNKPSDSVRSEGEDSNKENIEKVTSDNEKDKLVDKRKDKHKDEDLVSTKLQALAL